MDKNKIWNKFLLIWFIGSGIYGIYTHDMFFVGISILVLLGRITFKDDKKAD